MRGPIGGEFQAFLAAQYSVAAPAELPTRQLLEIEDAFMAGAQAGFILGSSCTDDERRSIRQELAAFGAAIVARYAAAGLPLGQRRS